MAYKINGTEVIDDNGELVNFSAYNLNNDDGQIEIQSNSPMVGTVSGYTSGGYDSPPGGFTNVIDKFPFSVDTNATNVGDLTKGRYLVAAQSSSISGYTSGGNGPGNFDTIDKFPFATDSNATDVGNLIQATRRGAGQSSFVSGYISGGVVPPDTTAINTIVKFPFAADTNASDVGDLDQARSASRIA